MADVVETCSRCGKLIQGGPALVVVQSGPRAPAQPVINLCPACADSMSRWFARRHHAPPGSRSPRPNPSNDRTARRIAIAITTTISFASAAGGGGGEGG